MRRICVLMVLLVASCRPDPHPFDAALARDSGRDAVNCGVVDRKAGDRRAEARAEQCVERAFKARRPFRVRYLDQGADSPFMSGRAASPAGEVFFYSFDGRSNRVTRFTCSSPQLQAHEGHSHLVCMSCLECSGVEVK